LQQWTYGKELADAIYAASTGGPNDQGAQRKARELLNEHAHSPLDCKSKYSYEPEKLGNLVELQKKRKLAVAFEVNEDSNEE
jgi:hypothetical protein